MTASSNFAGVHEPTVETIQLVCDRLADLGLAVGPDVARDLVRAILMAEAPRLDARVRDALGTSLETIRVAAQSAIGLLTATTPVAAGRVSQGTHPAGVAAGIPAPPPAAPMQRAAAAGAAGPSAVPAPQPPPVPPAPGRPIARRGPSDERPDMPPATPDRARPDEGINRPVFKRPRGR